MANGTAYRVKEIFGPTVQGEGVHAGTPCVFLRFASCNLACSWCDTDFSISGARSMTAREITAELQRVDASQSRLVIVTGGEPALQWDELLASEVAAAGFRCHMESNGTRSLKGKVDWLTVSPKPQFHEGRFNLDENTVSRADECKIVVDDSVDVEVLDRMSETFGSAQLLVQPCHDERYAEHLARTLALLQQRPHWRLSLQLHKIIGVP